MTKSWEDYVNEVCVLGRPDRVTSLAGEWDVLFHNARSVADALADGIRDLEKTFTGPAGDEYRKRLDTIAKQITAIETDNRKIITMLQAASQQLNEAQQSMPVPDTMLDEVNNRRAELDRANSAGASAMSIYGGGAGLVANMFFNDALANSPVGNAGREVFGWFKKKVDDWNGEMTDEAKRVYDDVSGKHRTEAAVVGNPTSAGQFDSQNQDFKPGATSTSGRTPGGVGGTGAGGFKSSSAGLHPSAAGYSGPGSGSFDPSTGGVHPGTGNYTPKPGSEWDGSALAGAGDGGFGGATDFKSGGGANAGSFGGGAGALGAGGGGLGAGAGGLGAAGLGGLGAPVGRGVGMPSATPPGGGGKGAGGMMGGAPMGGGHGAGGNGDERSTWLEEDEDVWGLNDVDGPPNFLGR